jgi:DNA-binding NtrC family response regulator
LSLFDEQLSWLAAGYRRSAGYSFAICIADRASRSTPVFNGDAVEIPCDIGLAIASDVNILISGGNADARTSLACLIHQRSDRGAGSFVVFAPQQASETAETRAMLHASAGGTLFIEELAALNLETQDELLRLVDARQSAPPSAVPRRVIAATGDNLLDRIAAEKFNAELFYRLNSIHLVLRPRDAPACPWVM